MKLLKFLSLAFLTLALLLPLSAQAAPTLKLEPSPLTIKASDRSKTLVKVSLSEKPSATLKVTVSAGAEIALGKTVLTFTPDNYNQTGSDPDAHNFGVTLTDKAKNGQQLQVALTGQLSTEKITASLPVVVSETAPSAPPTASTGKEVIKAEDLAGSQIKLEAVFPSLVRWALTIIAIGAFLGLLYSGFLFITAGGDPSKAQLAHRNILWSLTGIGLALISFLLVQLAANFTSLDSGRSDTSSPSLPPLVNGETTTLLLTNNFGQPTNEYLISDPSLAFSTKIGIKLATKPTKDVVLTVSTEGKLQVKPLLRTITVTAKDWQNVHYLPVTYDGSGTYGERGRIIVTNNKEERSVLFRVDENGSPIEQPPE